MKVMYLESITIQTITIGITPMDFKSILILQLPCTLYSLFMLQICDTLDSEQQSTHDIKGDSEYKNNNQQECKTINRRYHT